jgi:metal-responsive CopG/Arc/MetJ family transcriptional regulator
MSRAPKQKTLSVIMPEPLVRELDKAAEQDGRTISSLVRKILSDWVETHKHKAGGAAGDD